MANSTNPLPPFPPPQPPDLGVQLDNPGEQAIQGFQYGPGPATPPPGAVLTTLATGLHFEYAVCKRIYYFSGLRCTPVGGPVGTPMSVTRETAPFGKLEVYWRSARRNADPVIPSRDLQDPNCVFEKGYVDLPGTGYLADGGRAFVRTGCYIYWLRVPYEELDTILAAAFPGVGDDIGESALEAADYSRTVIGPNRPPLGAPTDLITF